MAVIGTVTDRLYEARTRKAVFEIKKKCPNLPVVMHKVCVPKGENRAEALVRAVVLRDIDAAVIELEELYDMEQRLSQLAENVCAALIFKAGNPGNVLITRKHAAKFGHAVVECDSENGMRQLEKIYDGIICRAAEHDAAAEINRLESGLCDALFLSTDRVKILRCDRIRGMSYRYYSGSENDTRRGKAVWVVVTRKDNSGLLSVLSRLSDRKTVEVLAKPRL